MKIGIDIFSYDKPGANSGVGPSVYVWKLLPELFKQGYHHQFIVFVNNDNKNILPLQKNLKIVVSPFSNRFRFLRVLHEQCYLPYQFRKHKLNIIHFFGNNISYALSRKSVITIHDLMWKYYLDRCDLKPKYLYFYLTIPYTIKLSKYIITVSKFIAEEIKGKFNRKEGVIPIYEAPGDIIFPSNNETHNYSQKYNYKYIYTVTTSLPHKNLKVLLEAFLQIKKSNLFEGRLVITGQLKGNFHQSTIEFIRLHQLENDIVLTGFITDTEKTYCYQHALIVVYPSLYEGFGLPILEAMIAGTPVITSNAASMPEVGGSACIYFDPKSTSELFDKMSFLLKNTSKQSDMVGLGKIQCKKFSWGITAEETLQVYDKMSDKSYFTMSINI